MMHFVSKIVVQTCTSSKGYFNITLLLAKALNSIELPANFIISIKLVLKAPTKSSHFRTSKNLPVSADFPPLRSISTQQKFRTHLRSFVNRSLCEQVVCDFTQSD